MDTISQFPEDLYSNCRPILKWPGGKTQLLSAIKPRLPNQYGRYIEPFIGGGALFFSLRPSAGVIADINPELVNLYRSIAEDVDGILECLREHTNTEEYFYSLRALDWQSMTPTEAAARTCFNGMYRVNKKGQFNVPYGHYKSPKIINEEVLRANSLLLQDTTIVCGDYKTVIGEYAKPGDFIFLDPPYLPVSDSANFNRYSKEGFTADHHIDLANEVKRLRELGCYVMLTNSNHALVHEQYAQFEIEVLQTKRFVSSNGGGRKGEDVIVTTYPIK